jgi:hypothetical protein
LATVKWNGCEPYPRLFGLIFRLSLAQVCHPQDEARGIDVIKGDPEFLLAVACCRWPPAPAREALVRNRVEGIDWGRFGALLRRHRIEGLAHHALSAAAVSLPPQFGAVLAAEASAIARQNLAFAAESRRLARLFEAGQVPFLFVKGATLDKLAYGTLALKKGRDIDLSIAPETVERACELMKEAGYDRVIPGPEIGPERFPIWVRLCKETNWKHPKTGIFVELHNGLVDNPELLRGVGAHSPAQMVEIGPGIRLQTLRDEELYAYLCVHGATHAWSRLKWIGDLAAFLSHRSPDGIERLHRAAIGFGSGRASAQALLLCADLFDTRLSPSLAAELAADRSARWLARAALRVMAGEEELDDTVFGTVPIHLSHFLLGPGLGFKLAEAGRKMQSRHDQVSLKLPRPLRFLYPIILLPSWVWRRIRGPAPI